MINVLALVLLVSSLTASAVRSPLPDSSPSPSPADRTVVRKGHRVVIIEYERQLVPSPRHPDEAKEKKLHEATSQSLPNLGQRVSSPEATPTSTGGGDVAPTLLHSAKEVVCDAYGSCKEKLSNIKEHVSDEASHVKEEAQYLVEEGKAKASHMKEVAQHKLSHKASRAKEETENAAEKAADRAEEVAGAAIHRNLSDVLRRAKDVASDAAGLVHAEAAARAAVSGAHLLGFAVAYGTGFWVTFVSSYLLASLLPRQQLGTVQSRMYPVYFRTMAYGVGLAAAAQWLGPGMKERAQGFNLVAGLALVLVNMMYLEPKATQVMFERMRMEKEEGRGRDMADVVDVEPVLTTASMQATTTTTNPTSTTHATPATCGARTTSTRTAAAAATAAAVEQEAATMKGRTVKLKKRLKTLNTYSSVLNILSLAGLTWHLVHLAGRMEVTC